MPSSSALAPALARALLSDTLADSGLHLDELFPLSLSPLPLDPPYAPLTRAQAGMWALAWLEGLAAGGDRLARARLDSLVFAIDDSLRFPAWDTPQGHRWWEDTLARSAEAWTSTFSSLLTSDLVPGLVHPACFAPWSGLALVPHLVLAWASEDSPGVAEASCYASLSPAAQEVALRLWDPFTRGAFASLAAACDAALRTLA